MDEKEINDEIKEMKRDCKETHERVSEEIKETIESVHALAREVNGKMANVYNEIYLAKMEVTSVNANIDKTFSKQKSYIIGVLISFIIMLLTSFGSFAWTFYTKKDIVKRVESAKILSDYDFERVNKNLKEILREVVNEQQREKKK